MSPGFATLRVTPDDSELSEMAREFQTGMPQSLQGKLELIMRAHQADENLRGITAMVLG
jgi:hypothetical protein